MSVTEDAGALRAELLATRLLLAQSVAVSTATARALTRLAQTVARHEGRMAYGEPDTIPARKAYSMDLDAARYAADAAAREAAALSLVVAEALGPDEPMTAKAPAVPAS